MRRPRRRSMVSWVLELPLRLLFALGVAIVRLIILVRSCLPASLLLLLCALIPLIGFSFTQLEGLGSWIMLAAALGLAFAAGTLKK